MSLASYITYTKREAKSDKVFHKNRKEQSKSTPKSIAIFEVLAFIPDRFLEQSSLPVLIDPTKINSFTFILARNNEKTKGGVKLLRKTWFRLLHNNSSCE